VQRCSKRRQPAKPIDANPGFTKQADCQPKLEQRLPKPEDPGEIPDTKQPKL